MGRIYLLGPFRLDAEAAILFRGAEPGHWPNAPSRCSS